MIIFYFLTAIFIAWIWVDYYRLIDIFETDRLKYFILAFLFGCLSVPLVLFLNKYILDGIPFEMNGTFINDFLYCIFKIGMVEETAKIAAFFLFAYFFKKQINEPIDYLAYICTCALGFSAIENALYFMKHGPDIINGRAILSTVGHMFDTSLIAYGIIRSKYYHKNNDSSVIFIFFLLAALSHGFYDFWLLYEGTKSGGWLITIIYFLITISIFAVIINNALNHSSYFSYKKVIDSGTVAKRLINYYAIVFGIQFVLLSYMKDLGSAIGNLVGSIYFSGFIVVVSCVRLSRFKLIKERWHKIKIELPFGYVKGDPYGMNSSSTRLRIKGDSFNEVHVNRYYEEYFALHPLSKKTTYLAKNRISFIEKKIFLQNDDTYYVTKVFITDEKGEHKKILLKPKTSDVTMVNKTFPIVAVLEVNTKLNIDELTPDNAKFRFKEWAFIKPHVIPVIEQRIENQEPREENRESVIKREEPGIENQELRTDS